jgi:cell division protein FtsW (lipid II flippase)
MGWFGKNRDVQWVILGAVAALCVAAFLILHRLIPQEEGMYNAAVVKSSIREILSHARLIGQGREMGADVLYTPMSSNWDHIVTYLIYSYGWICLAAILVAYALFFAHGFRLCIRQNSSMGKFMSLAALLTLFIETALYITNDLGLTEFSVSLPLFSYANILTVVFMTQLGIILSVNRTGGLVCDVM